MLECQTCQKSISEESVGMVLEPADGGTVFLCLACADAVQDLLHGIYGLRIDPDTMAIVEIGPDVHIP